MWGTGIASDGLKSVFMAFIRFVDRKNNELLGKNKEEV